MQVRHGCRFQFLYGAIGRRGLKKWIYDLSCFNSYMVRLEDLVGRCTAQSILVSIPIWCDWKSKALACLIRGSLVSIPIWCDWKSKQNGYEYMTTEFQFLYGAIGRGDPAALRPGYCRFNSYLVRLEGSRADSRCSQVSVSIPIWCDWKDRELTVDAHKFQFQFLFGAIGRLYELLEANLLKSFNSYLVRLEEQGREIVYFSGVEFQFLFGAIGSLTPTSSIFSGR